MYCTKCGNEVADGSLFCHMCGALMPSGAGTAETPVKESPTPVINKINNPYVAASDSANVAQQPAYQPPMASQVQPQVQPQVVPPPDMPRMVQEPMADESIVDNDYQEVEEEESGTSTLCEVMFYIAVFAVLCELAKFLGYPDSYDYLRPSGAKLKILNAVANFLGSIPDWVVGIALYGSMSVVFFCLKNYLNRFKINGGVKVMLEVVCYSVITLGVVSIIPETGDDVVDYYISGFLEVCFAVECIVLGAMLLRENTGGMATMMMVYGILTIGIMTYLLILDEWDLPEFWVFVLIGVLLFSPLVLMIKSIVSFLGANVDD